MTAKFKTALAAAFALVASPAFAQDAHVFDRSALLSKIAAQTSLIQAKMTNAVMVSAELRLLPKFAAIEMRPAAAANPFAAEMPMLKRPIQIASR